MAQREASVKLTLDDGEYIVSMRKAGDEGEAAGKKGAKGMSAFQAGIKGAQDGLRNFGGTVSKVTGLVTGLAAGFSVGSALKGATELDAKYKQLAFRMSVANQQQIKAAEIQKIVEQAAAKSGRRAAEMADTFDELSAATGDMDFTADSLQAIGEAATATGKPIGVLAQLADQLHTKFGVSAGEMGDALAQVFEASTKGGPSLEEFAATSGAMGAELLQAGLKGRRGLDFMLGSLVQTDDEMKNLGAQVKGVKQILLSLGDQNQIKGLAKTLGVDPSKLLNEKDLIGRMKRVLAMGDKGLKALKGSMHEAEEQKALRILFTDPFEKALKEAQASGKKGKAAIDDALRVLDDGMAQFGKATIDGSHIQAEAAERMQDPEMRLQMALEALERSFARPEIIQAIDELSDYLPGLAKSVGDVVKFVAQHPLLAGGLALGGNVGLGAAKGVGANLLDRGGDLLSAQVKSADVWATKVGAAHKLGGIQMGNAIRGAAALGAIAIAAAMAKEQIDKSFGEDAKTTGDLAVAGARAGSMKGGLKKQIADADALRAAIRAKRESQSGLSGFTQDLFGGLATLADKNAPNLRAQNNNQIAEMEDLLKQKEARIAELQRGGGEKPAAAATDAKAHRDQGKATAEALAQKTLRVEVVGGIPGAPAGRAGPGGSRGQTRPSAPAPGGGY